MSAEQPKNESMENGADRLIFEYAQILRSPEGGFFKNLEKLAKELAGKDLSEQEFRQVLIRRESK